MIRWTRHAAWRSAGDLALIVSQKLGTFVASVNGAGLVDLGALIEAGKITPAVDRS